MSEAVTFTRMDEGTYEDYQLLDRRFHQHAAGFADEVLAMLRKLGGDPIGYRIDRLQHSLQTATRAQRDGAAEEIVVAALLHDIGDVLAPYNHADIAAAILRPYVSQATHWLVAKHAVFQGYYYWHHYGQDRNAREKYRGHPLFERTAAFCEDWDQRSFDPGYDTLPLAAFEPMVRRLFERPRYEDYAVSDPA
jgi:predicted HD phosphohydrolase